MLGGTVLYYVMPGDMSAGTHVRNPTVHCKAAYNPHGDCSRNQQRYELRLNRYSYDYSAVTANDPTDGPKISLRHK